MRASCWWVPQQMRCFCTCRHFTASIHQQCAAVFDTSLHSAVLNYVSVYRSMITSDAGRLRYRCKWPILQACNVIGRRSTMLFCSTEFSLRYDALVCSLSSADEWRLHDWQLPWTAEPIRQVRTVFGVGQNLATFSVAVYSDRMLVASPKTWD